jgi:thymidylate kinase
MIIIFEGPDCSGKTTLIQKLGLHRIYVKYKFRNCMPAYHQYCVQEAIKLDKQGANIALDRLWPSEYIYGDVHRGGTSFPYYAKSIERLIPNAKYVFCLLHDKQDYLKRFYSHLDNGRIELYNRKADEIYDMYNLFLYGGNCKYRFDNYLDFITQDGYLKINKNAFRFDWTKQDISELKKHIGVSNE